MRTPRRSGVTVAPPSKHRAGEASSSGEELPPFCGWNGCGKKRGPALAPGDLRCSVHGMAHEFCAFHEAFFRVGEVVPTWIGPPRSWVREEMRRRAERLGL